MLKDIWKTMTAYFPRMKFVLEFGICFLRVYLEDDQKGVKKER
jgi:hypothetical protein